MSFSDSVNYILFKNPVSKATIGTVNSLVQVSISAVNKIVANCSEIVKLNLHQSILSVISLQGIKPKSTSSITRPAVTAAQSAISHPLWKAAGGNYLFIRIAAVTGASAVCLAAYGKHKLNSDAKELQGIWESANKMHLIHSVVLLVVPFTKRPVIVSSID